MGYIPQAASHYVENTGDEDVIFLEVLQAPKFGDVSAAQWLALTPKQVVQDHLKVSDAFWNNLPKEKEYIKTGNTNMTALATSSSANSNSSSAKRDLPDGGVEENKREVTFFA